MRVNTAGIPRILYVAWIVVTFGIASGDVRCQISLDPTTIYSFPGTVSGGHSLRNPQAGLTVGPGGHLYGNCSRGGSFNVGGVFRISTDGLLTELASFDGTNGANIQAPVVFGTNGHLYGIAFQGGPSGQFGIGTVYSYRTNGALTALVSFQGSPYGSDPTAFILNTNDNFFYGTCARFGTAQPGAFAGGTVFKMNHAGVVTPFHTFNPNREGSAPNSIVLGPGGIMYGANSEFVFKVSPAGVVTSYVGFSNNITGTQPALYACATDGTLYGSTRYGTDLRGSIFKITPNGVLQTLQTSVPTPGGLQQPVSGITLSPSGIYGTTLAGGEFGRGDIFRISSSGKIVSFVSFYIGPPSTNGWAPSGLIYHPSGDLYGTTGAGGSSGQGMIFRLSQVPTRMSSPALRFGRVGFYWPSISGQTYQVQTRANFQGGNWTTITNQIATNTITTFSEPTTSSQRFYRLLLD